MDKVAVVILNWNGCELLKQFLPSVVSYTEQDGGVVYVADNGSEDSSLQLLRKMFTTVSIIALGKNYGFAEGYNKALEAVDAEYVVLLNSDVEVTPHWLRPLLDFMDSHPHVAACQPKLRSWHQKEAFEYAGASGGFIDRYGYPYCRGRIMSAVEKDNGQYDDIIPVAWATGAALFIRLADYKEAGGLDGRFFAHMEEVDLCWRLWSLGREVYCVPQSVVYHVGGGTLQKENPRKTFLNFRNNLLMLYKNLPDDRLKSVMAMRAVLDYVAALSFLLKGEWRSAWMVLKARHAYRGLRKDYTSFRSKMHNLRRVRLPFFQERDCILWSYYLKGIRKYSDLDK